MFLKHCDMFGVPQQNFVENNQTHFKTVLGGIISILVFVISLLYFSYVMYQWDRGFLLPKIQTQTNIINYEEITTSFSPIEIGFFKNKDLQQDPMSQNNNYITPVAQKIATTSFQTPYTIFNQNPSISASFYPGAKLNNSEAVRMILNNNDLDKDEMLQYLIYLSKCSPTLLEPNQSCAQEEEIDNFLQSSFNLLYLRVNLQKFNLNTKAFEQLFKESYYLFDTSLSNYQQVILKTTKLRVDTGLIFSSIQEYKYISDYVVQSQTLSLEFIERQYGSEIPFTCLVRLDALQDTTYVSYPNLGEVMASVGSIVSILFMTRYLVMYYNGKQLEKHSNQQILQIYQQSLTPQTLKIARLKLNVYNQIYEKSRLQMLVQNLVGKDEMMRLLNKQETLKVMSPESTELRPIQKQQVHPASQEEHYGDTFDLLTMKID